MEPVDSSRHLPISLRIVSMATFVFERVSIQRQETRDKTCLSSSCWSTKQNRFIGTKCYWIELALHAIKGFKTRETLSCPFWQVGDWYNFTRRDGLRFRGWYMNFLVPFFARLNDPCGNLVVLLDIKRPPWLKIVLSKSEQGLQSCEPGRFWLVRRHP